MKSFGIWLALLATVFLVALPTSAASPEPALALATQSVCAADRGPADTTRDHLSTTLPGDAEEENEEDGSDDDVADAHAHLVSWMTASARAAAFASDPSHENDCHDARAHAPRGPPAIR